jgi:exopolysaccharide biosynthesis polyprenyl glycosylphosphotransferase
MERAVGDLTEVVRTESRVPELRTSATRRRKKPRSAVLAAVDATLILVGFAIAYWMRYIVDWPPPIEQVVREVATQNFVPLSAFMPIALLLTVLLLGQFTIKGLYRLPRTAGLLDHASMIMSSTITGIALLVVVLLIARPFFYSRLIFAFACVVISVLLCLWRGALLGYWRWRWVRGIGRERVLVVGGTGLGRQVMEGIVALPFLGYALTGYLEDREPPPNERPNGHFRHLGPIASLKALVQSGTVDQVIIALPFWQHQLLPELVLICRAAGVEFRVVPDLYELSFDRVDVGDLSGIPLIGLKELSLKGANLVIKRTMDLLIVLLGTPLILPVAAVIALAIKRDSPGPAIFKQERIGKSGKPFITYKFRTMVADAEARKAELAALNEADGPIFKIRDDPRTTQLGRVLRRTSLDELPQLWNVVRGEMSLVGPRPPTPEEVAQYEEWHKRRIEVRPGMTGLWQVLGRSDTSFDEMVRLDIYYAENWSPGMDLRIMLQTIPVVLSGKGAY